MTISVCIAAYNGSKFIEKQLSSILIQLGDNDEIIVVDDCSSDDTVDVVKKIDDSRIKLLINEKNLGVIKNFEKSIAYASGEIIFLSDQDDIWLPDKVHQFMQVFRERPDITLVLSEAQVINGDGQILVESYFQMRGKFMPGIIANIVKNKYLGCTIAFRKQMKKIFLPFPQDIPMHDMWIGILNEIYGKTLYIPQPTIQYRLHDNNASAGPVKSASIQQILKWRYALIKNLIGRVWQNTWQKS